MAVNRAGSPTRVKHDLEGLGWGSDTDGAPVLDLSPPAPPPQNKQHNLQRVGRKQWAAQSCAHVRVCIYGGGKNGWREKKKKTAGARTSAVPFSAMPYRVAPTLQEVYRFCNGIRSVSCVGEGVELPMATPATAQATRTPTAAIGENLVRFGPSVTLG